MSFGDGHGPTCERGRYGLGRDIKGVDSPRYEAREYEQVGMRENMGRKMLLLSFLKLTNECWEAHLGWMAVGVCSPRLVAGKQERVEWGRAGCIVLNFRGELTLLYSLILILSPFL